VRLEAEHVQEWCESHGVESPLSVPTLQQKAPRRTAKQIIRRSGHSIETLAALAGVSTSTINRIISGKLSYERHPESLKNLAAVLGCDWQDLLPQDEG
jgi:transcriptional regulator with XRE-family HTH domain